MSSSVEIVPVEGRALRRAFLAVPDHVYGDDKAWRSPLKFERAAHLDPKKNPGAPAHANRQLFLAERAGVYIGRIAAFLNPEHDSYHNEKAGFFGFFDCMAEPEIGAALLQAAQSWLTGRGAVKIIGPAQWSVNEECGLLIDGFDTPPVVMMPHGKPAYQAMIEGQGFKKATDMYAFQSQLDAGYPRPRVAQAMVRSRPSQQRYHHSPHESGELYG